MADAEQSTTKKHREFLRGPMGEKEVTALAGIGPKYGQNLQQEGFEKAHKVLGQFLVCEKDKEPFVKWLRSTSFATGKYATDCYNCLKDWTDSFV